jgi:protoporphyrinogen oxidase
MAYEEKSIGIVGSGLLGMVLALRLAEQGHRITLIECSEDAGGLASSCRIGDYIWDRFYHVILLSDSHTLSLIEQLKIRDQLNWRETKTGFYSNGKLYSISNFIEFLKFPPLNILDKMRFGWTILYASKIKDWKSLEKVRSVDWLRKNSGQRSLDKIWLPLLKSKLGDNCRLASAAFIWAHISRLYAARRTGLKKEIFGYVNGGYKTVLDHLQRLLDAQRTRIIYSARVQNVIDSGSQVSIETENRNSLTFDKLIMTIPCTQILKLCSQLSPPEVTRLKSVHYQNLVCGIFLLRRSLSDFYITNLADNSLPFTGIIEMTALVDKNNFGGNTLVYLPRYLTNDDPFINNNDEEIKNVFLASLKALYPVLNSQDLIAHCISRIIDFPVIPTLNYSLNSIPLSVTSMKNVFIVNSAQIPSGTININEIINLANIKARELKKVGL